MSCNISHKDTGSASNKNENDQKFDLLCQKSKVLFENGLFEEALRDFNLVERQFKNLAEYHNTLGKIYQALNNTEFALKSLDKAIILKPHFFEAHNNLGVTYSRAGNQIKAKAAYEKAIELSPSYADGYNNLGLYWSKEGNLKRALTCFSTALKHNPSLAEVYNNIAIIFMKINRTSDAIEMFQKALQLNPLYVDAHNNLGNAYKTLGSFGAATNSYKRALSIKPENSEVFFNLSQINVFVDDDPLLFEAEKRLKASHLKDLDKMLLNFSLGKIYDDKNVPELAVNYIKQGNKIRNNLAGYQFEKDLALVKRMNFFFSNSQEINYNQKNILRRKKSIPIFVVGMPRSGTTVIEQILSSHPDVFGAGELPWLGDLVNRVDFTRLDNEYDLLKEIRKPYLLNLDQLGQSCYYIVDKMPLNFLWIGLIIFTIPEAKIVHVKRDARATCWSVYKHLFGNIGTEFGYNLEDLTRFYKLYTDLMKYWHTRFPNKIYDIDYDELTINQETETKNLLEYVNLKFRSSCIDFHNNNREVATASAKQVRQKMYQGSSRSWLKYKKYLPKLVNGLKDY